MKKRIIAAMLSLSLAVCAVSGCGDKEQLPAEGGNAETKQDESGQNQTEQNQTKQPENDGEIVNLIWQWPSFGYMPPGFQDVEDALNEMLERDIGVHVTLEPVGLYEAQNEAILMVSSGEQLDICLTAFTGIGPLVDKGLIYPLDDIIETYGRDIIEHAGVALEGCYYDGHLYGVPTTAEAPGREYGYSLKKSYADKYDLNLEEDRIYTMEELEEIFDTIQAGEEGTVYFVEPWNTTEDPLNTAYMPYDKVGGSLAGGVLMLGRSTEDLTLVNLFETEEYKEYCERMYRWMQKGYMEPDIAVSTEAAGAKIGYDNYAGNFGFYCPWALAKSDIGHDVYTLKTVEAYAVNNGGPGTIWNIPITSVNPAKALETVNYLMKNKEAAWLLQCGLEGENYEVLETDGTDTVMRYLYDTVNDWQSMPYVQPYGLYGDRFEMLIIDPSPITANQLRRQVADSIPQSRYSPAIGYSFVSDSVSTEIAAVSTVINQYFHSLNCGALDPEKALPEFIDALKSAGIDKIIAENQRQLDAWAASR